MKTYKHLFFDLDGTLWDFERNSAETLSQLFAKHLQALLPGLGADAFINLYNPINHNLWEEYKKGRVTREQVSLNRFDLTLEAVGIKNTELAHILEKEYLTESPRKTALLPGALQVLDALQPEYTMHIITNGFKNVQLPKLENSGLRPYFSTLTISEEAGCLKPCPDIFHHALNKAGAKPGESLMIGDDPDGDIIGAGNAGLHTVYFKPNGSAHPIRATFIIKELNALLNILL
jgi:putative hydrolase of the HAD superfamily